MSHDPAEVTKGGEGSNPVLDQLYDTLGAVQAGLQVRQEEGAELIERVKKQEQDLLDQRQQAEDAGDSDTFDRLTEKLDELRKAWTVLNDEELGGGTSTAEKRMGGDPRGRPGGGGDAQARPGADRRAGGGVER